MRLLVFLIKCIYLQVFNSRNMDNTKLKLFTFHVSPLCYISFIWCNSPQWARTSSFMRCLDHTQRRTTFGRNPLDEWSARHRYLFLTTHNTYMRYPWRRRDSNPQSQHASGRRPTPETEWPLGSACATYTAHICLPSFDHSETRNIN
jgi:hypothetical protein